MKENKGLSSKEPAENITKPQKFIPKKLFSMLCDAGRGFLMGVAFIIPGFSGGSVAAILGIYERLVNDIADIFKSFKKSILSLLPIAVGLVLGAVSLLYPLQFFLARYPLPTVSLFVGLAIGGIPSITSKLDKKPRPIHALSFLIPFITAFSLSFIPTLADRDLTNLTFVGCILLVIVGFVGSFALVIPGISGSMLLLILGYYNPILTIITEDVLSFRNLSGGLPVILLVAFGIAVGFIYVSKVMKLALNRCPYGTYIAITGFIIGSLPTVYVSACKDAGYTASTIPQNPIFYLTCILFLVAGIAVSFSAVILGKKAKSKT